LELYHLILGMFLFACGVYVAAKKAVLGEHLYSYYTRPRRQGRFQWIHYRLIKPTRGLTTFMAWTLGAATASVGLIFIALSLPK